MTVALLTVVHLDCRHSRSPLPPVCIRMLLWSRDRSLRYALAPDLYADAVLPYFDGASVRNSEFELGEVDPFLVIGSSFYRRDGFSSEDEQNEALDRINERVGTHSPYGDCAYVRRFFLRRFAARVPGLASGLAHAVRPAGSALGLRDRVGDRVAPSPPTPPDMRPASGGSSSRRIETLPGLTEGLQAEAVPVGVGQGHLKDLGASNPPVPLAATRPFPGAALRDTAYPQVVPLGDGGLSLPMRNSINTLQLRPVRTHSWLFSRWIALGATLILTCEPSK
jgi:hypothetical protein